MDQLNDKFWDELSKSIKRGYDINPGAVLEIILTHLIATNYQTTELLRRQLELEQLVRSGTVDFDKVRSELSQLLNELAEKATKRKNEYLTGLAEG